VIAIYHQNYFYNIVVWLNEGLDFFYIMLWYWKKDSGILKNMKLENKDYMFVGLQGLLFVAYLLNVNLFQINISKVIYIIGICIAITGALVALIALSQLNTNLSPFPSPKSNISLITNGIYKYSRHPIYTGILGILLGYGLYAGSGYKIFITIMLLVLFYYKSKYEEKKLSSMFSKYPEYMKTTGMFLPKAL